MYYLLSEDLSCCDVEGRLIFLDIRRDLYFLLAYELESSVRDFLNTGVIADEQLKELTAKDLLIDEWNTAAPVSLINFRRPTRSAAERSVATARSYPATNTIVEVMMILWLTRRQLKSRRLKAIIEDTISYRSSRTNQKIVDSDNALDGLLSVASQFTQARRCVPIEPRCLLDSLALLKFLSKRGMAANIVFGVTLAPFAAHCWVQAAGIVLNETLSDANAHTPIRVI